VAGLTFNAAVSGFFDKEPVIRALNRGKLRIFKEFCRLVRKAAQKSLVYGERPAPPGATPTAHRSRSVTKVSKSTGKTRKRSISFLREYLYFSFDRATESVVIGPARLGNTVTPDALPALEYGGTSTIVRRGKRQRVRVAARPFMRPAAAAELPNLPPMWRDSVR